MPEILNMPRCEFADALHADPTPDNDLHGYAVEVQCEKPWHRLAILLAASGHTVTEIAEKLERSISHVSILLRQDWARERLTMELAIAGRDEITEILKSAGAKTLRRVIALSETAESEQVQLAASREVLDRLLGKPVQKLETKQEVFHTDMNALDEDIKRLEVEEARLLGRN
jgi:predicted nuclease with TOPRIM domain